MPKKPPTLQKPPTLRARQAQLTRDEILGAARRLFAAQGYSRTSVRDIDVEADIAAIVGAGVGSHDPAQILAVQAKVVRSILEHCGDILRALVTGAAAEPDLALVLAEGHRRHMEGTRRM